MIYLGADHGGFELKEAVKRHLREQGAAFEDCGTYSADSVDYPHIAALTCERILKNKGSLGVLCCGTGLGMSMAANKLRGIRAACCSDCFSARYSRLHNDANVLCLGGRVVGVGLALELVDVFLRTGFEGGRHERRVCQIAELENR